MCKKRLINLDVVIPPKFLLGLFMLVIMFGTALARADDPNRVGLVVVHGDGETIKKCVEFSENELNGYQVLERAGLDINTEADGGMGAAICSIDNEGCNYPEEKCFCQCSGGETCIFWSYWYLRDGSWQFSPMGASGHSVQHGDVEGWVWGGGSPEGGAASPPDLTFADICQPPATDTPSPTPHPTDTPTPTPAATNTPEPKEKPVIHHFSADRTEITARQVVQLSWDLSDADAAYLRYNGREEGVISPGSKNVSPAESTVFTLAAQNNGGETIAQITITVNDAPAPASTPILAVTPVPVTAGPESSPAATDTPAPAPVINFNAAAPTLPPGACTNIQWSVEQAEAIFLNDTPVEPVARQQACPAQTQTYKLRAVYPGGEKIVELTLTVTEAGIAPTDTPLPTTTPTQTAPTGAAVAAIVSTSVPETPTGPRRFTVSLPKDDSRSGGILWTGAALTAAGLFFIAPLALIIVSWLVWWIRGKKR